MLTPSPPPPPFVVPTAQTPVIFVFQAVMCEEGTRHGRREGWRLEGRALDWIGLKKGGEREGGEGKEGGLISCPKFFFTRASSCGPTMGLVNCAPAPFFTGLHCSLLPSEHML